MKTAREASWVGHSPCTPSVISRPDRRTSASLRPATEPQVGIEGGYPVAHSGKRRQFVHLHHGNFPRDSRPPHRDGPSQQRRRFEIGGHNQPILYEYRIRQSRSLQHDFGAYHIAHGIEAVIETIATTVPVAIL